MGNVGSYFIETFLVLSDKENGTDFTDFRIFVVKEKSEMNKLRQIVGGMWRVGLVVAAGGTVLASSCSTSEVKAILSSVTDITNQLDHSQNDNISFGDWLSSELDK